MAAYRVVSGKPGPLHVLVLGANLRQGMTSVRSLGRIGLRVGAAECVHEGRVPSFASRYCQVGIGVPDAVADEEAFLESLMSLLEDCPTSVILPVDDCYLRVLSKHRDEIEQYAAVALPQEPALSLLESKESTLGLARSLGIAVPEGLLVESLAEVPAAAHQVGFPAVVKPAESYPQPQDLRTNGIRLFCHDARDVEELRAVVKDMLDVGGRPIVQPWLPGAREAVSLFVADGEVHARFAQVAHRMMPPLGGSSIYRESITPPPDATEAAEALVLAAGLEGYAEVEFRRDVAGQPVLMEVNPRLSASVEIAVRSGVDFPLLIALQAASRPLPRYSGYRTGVRVRWLGGDIEWLAKSILERGHTDVPTLRSAIREVAAASLRRASYDYVDWRDPAPVLVASTRFAREALSVTRRRSGAG